MSENSKNKDNSKRTLKEEIAMTLEGYKVLIKIDKRFIWIPIVKSIFSAFLPFVNLFLSAQILTELTGKRDLRTLIIYAIITVSLNLIANVIQRTMETKENIYLREWWNKLNLFFNDINNTMQYEHLENPETHILRDKIYQAQQTVGGVFAALYWNLEGIVDNVFTVIFSIIFVSYYSSNRKSKIEAKAYESYAIGNETGNFYGDYLLNYNTGKDVRLYGLEKSLLKILKKYFNDADNVNIETSKKTLKFNILESASNDILQAAAYIFVTLACIAGNIAIGNILMYVTCITRFITSVGFTVSHSQFLINNNKYLEHYFEFLDIPSKMYQGTLPVEKRRDNEYEIEFRKVSFKYPGSDSYALKNLSMKLNIGQRLAVVGTNGSGKTTMIKLLCRLYDPTEGEITLNGFDIRKYDYDEYMAIFSVVFQDFRLFSFPLGQNVASSDKYDAKRATECLNMAGFSGRLGGMPKGLETSLYKDFDDDGVEISGGEAQKIALARALYKNAPFIVLDEPTASLDPIAEFEVYSKFNEIVGGKTAIYISHRLSSCRFCDDIAVFHEGELVQRGSHGALIADEGGKYRELWAAQAQYYAGINDNSDINPDNPDNPDI